MIIDKQRFNGIDREFDSFDVPEVKELALVTYGNEQTFEGHASQPINYGEGSQHEQ